MSGPLLDTLARVFFAIVAAGTGVVLCISLCRGIAAFRRIIAELERGRNDGR